MAQQPTLEQLIENWAPRLQAAFLQAVYVLRNRAHIDVIVTMLEKGDVDGALRAVGLDPAAFRALDKSIGDAFEAGGNLTTASIPPLEQPSGHRVSVMFNARNMEAESWLRTHSSQLVTSIIDDQRQAIRQHLVAGMEAGQNPRAVALDLVGRVSRDTGKREGGVVGLTASQEEWTRNYAAELASLDPNALTRTLRDKRFDPSVNKAIASGQPIPADLQAKMVTAYRNRALRSRAEAIGRTEALTALNTSARHAYDQAIAAGQVKAGSIRKIWRSAMDNKVRESHRALNGESISYDQPFRSPTGHLMAHPGDVSLGATAEDVICCRCVLNYRIDFLANVL